MRSYKNSNGLHTKASLVQDLGVDHGRSYFLMYHQLLEGPDILALL